jgi:tRNA(Ile2) C34 agmatinyltransferase TiaS
MTPAQQRAMFAFKAHQQALKESKNNPPCITCGNKIRMSGKKTGEQCFKCKHYKKNEI